MEGMYYANLQSMYDNSDEYIIHMSSTRDILETMRDESGVLMMKIQLTEEELGRIASMFINEDGTVNNVTSSLLKKKLIVNK